MLQVQRKLFMGRHPLSASQWSFPVGKSPLLCMLGWHFISLPFSSFLTSSDPSLGGCNSGSRTVIGGSPRLAVPFGQSPAFCELVSCDSINTFRTDRLPPRMGTSDAIAPSSKYQSPPCDPRPVPYLLYRIRHQFAPPRTQSLPWHRGVGPTYHIGPCAIAADAYNTVRLSLQLSPRDFPTFSRSGILVSG